VSRPCGLPTVEHFANRPCGTRAKYVAAKCRCAECRAANTRYYHERQARAKERAIDLGTPSFSGIGFTVSQEHVAAPQTWTAPDGSTRVRIYKRACAGVYGRPCPTRSHLRKDSVGSICANCREQLVWNGTIPAARARRHLLTLSRRGVGRRAVAAACDVADTVLQEIRSGKAAAIRRETERRILAVTPDAVADHALVPARQTIGRLCRLLDEGFTKAELARRLGSKARVPSLQIKAGLITAKKAAQVERLYRIVMAGA
jgi:hypothetical protein